MEASGPLSAVKTPLGVAARQTVVKQPAGPRLRLARLRLARGSCGRLRMAAALFQATATPWPSPPVSVSGTTFTSVLSSHAPGTSPWALTDRAA